MPGIFAVRSRCDSVTVKPASVLSNVMVAVVWMDSGVKPALPSSAESAIEKQPACAAAINSSGFVPTPFSKRVLNEYCASLSPPLSVEMLPLPSFKPSFQTADALRFINFLSMAGTGIRSSTGETNAGLSQSQVRQTILKGLSPPAQGWCASTYLG